MPDINPKLWGPPAWSYLSHVINAYESNPSSSHMHHYRELFENLQHTLPCSKCRANYAEHLSKYPLSHRVLGNKHSLLSWFNRLKTTINNSMHSERQEHIDHSNYYDHDRHDRHDRHNRYHHGHHDNHNHHENYYYNHHFRNDYGYDYGNYEQCPGNGYYYRNRRIIHKLRNPYEHVATRRKYLRQEMVNNNLAISNLFY